MVATSLLATSALLGTYLGNPRLGRAYAVGLGPICTVESAAGFKTAVLDTTCTTINITTSFPATNAVRAIASGDSRTSLTINGVGEGITITGGGSGDKFRLLENQKDGLSLTISNLTMTGFVARVYETKVTETGPLEILDAGGAIYSKGAITVTNSTFSENKAYHGGGFYSFGNATVTNSTFSGNTAQHNGGGFVSPLTATVTNSTFSGNLATGTILGSGSGGGFKSNNTTVTNSTFSTNTASLTGGGFRSDGTATVTNSIFTGNTAATSGQGFQSDGAITLSHSIFNTNDTVNTSNATGDGVIINRDPLLGALQDNGGSTLTMLPGTGSPAIDSGSNAAAAGLVDQRGSGFARIANGTVDMGAVEVQSIAASGGGGASSDGVGVNSLTTVLLKDQSGLDSDWSDTDIFLAALSNVLKEKPVSKLKVLADGSVKLTTFLPTDRAFRKLAFDLTGIRPRNDKAAMRVIESLDLETIEKVLLYHVVLGDPIGSSDALKANGVTLTTLSGETFSVRVTKRPNIFLRDLDKNLRNPKVLLRRVDINSGNRQVAHVINRVLIPVEDIK